MELPVAADNVRRRQLNVDEAGALLRATANPSDLIVHRGIFYVANPKAPPVFRLISVIALEPLLVDGSGESNYRFGLHGVAVFGSKEPDVLASCARGAKRYKVTCPPRIVGRLR